MSRWRIGYLYVLFLFIMCLPALSSAEEKGAAIEPRADKVLRQMSDYLNTLDEFSLHIDNSIDILLASGQKIQLARSADISVRRPNRLRADIKGDISDQQMFYDGKSITLYGKKVNFYATKKAPPDIEAALDYAEDSFGLVAPLADLVYRNSYDILMGDVQVGGYVGLSSIFGVECHHLAFRGEETDWQIWIENGEKPLPKKFVITSKWLAGAPQFTAVLSNWNVSPQLQDSLFIFEAPQGARKIGFLPAE